MTLTIVSFCGITPVVRGLILVAFLCLSSSAYADGDPEKFTMGNHDLQGSRSLPSPTGGTLTRAAVLSHGLEIKWFAATDAPVPGVPVVADGVVYVGTATADGSGNGSVYALDAETGAELWHVGAAEGIAGGVMASPLIAGDKLYVGTLIGSMHAIKRDTGAVLWSYKPSITPFDAIWAGPIKVRNKVIFALNPEDEYGVFDPPGITALIALDPHDGAQTSDDEIWRFTPVPPGEQEHVGGAGIWGTSPAYSSALNLIYVSTGQTTFSRFGSTPGSDSVFAIDADTGQVRWQTQFKAGDIWNVTMPYDPMDPIDMDVGEAPALFRVNGKERVAVGSKRGYFYVMDAETGAILNGAGQDAHGFSMGLDLFGGTLPGPGLNGGFNLDSGYFQKKGSVVHFGILNDFSLGMQDVANRIAPYDNGVCYVNLVGPPPWCPEIDYGHLVLINGDGTAELGRYSNPNASVVSPVYLDDMIFVRETADLIGFENDKLLVIDASDPTTPVLFGTVSLSTFSFGAQVSIAGGRIYTGSGFYSHFLGSPSGLYAIGLDED